MYSWRSVIAAFDVQVYGLGLGLGLGLVYGLVSAMSRESCQVLREDHVLVWPVDCAVDVLVHEQNHPLQRCWGSCDILLADIIHWFMIRLYGKVLAIGICMESFVSEQTPEPLTFDIVVEFLSAFHGVKHQSFLSSENMKAHQPLRAFLCRRNNIICNW